MMIKSSHTAIAYITVSGACGPENVTRRTELYLLRQDWRRAEAPLTNHHVKVALVCFYKLVFEEEVRGIFVLFV